MANLDAFDVLLDRVNSTYAAGDIVYGNVYISVTPKQRIRVKELFVTLCGEAKTNWVNKVSDNIYDALEPYINEKRSLKTYLDQAYDERGALSIGTHRIPFQFDLPRNLPFSYESEFGYIRYTCRAEVHISSADVQRAMSFRSGFSPRNKTISLEKTVYVTALVTLSQLSTSRQFRGLRKEDGLETVDCCGLRVGSVNAELCIGQSAYTVGQVIPFEAVVANHAKRRLPSAEVSLVQEVHLRSISYFRMACDSKTVIRTVQSVKFETPERGGSVRRRGLLPIPADAPATSVRNTIITVAYKLRFDVGRCFEIVLPVGIASNT